MLQSFPTTHQDQHFQELPQYIHITQNEFLHRKHKKQIEEDIAVCVCTYNVSDPDSACGERCLNVLTSTECTPDYCPCGANCMNQKFQKCEYANTKLFKTEGRGWGLLADQNIKAGQFIIEYCGEVISSKEADRRSHAYETEGLKDAFIITLNASESLDATKKGSIARFINHSCQPNCETRKWTVLGEIRVGIFAKQDILIGAELAYDYNFEWYGGAKVRCLCGAACCSGFLGAKSRGFQEDTYLWEDDDDRYSVEKIPLYDSAEDEPSSKMLKTMDSPDTDGNKQLSVIINHNLGSQHPVESTAHDIDSAGVFRNAIKSEETNLHSQDSQKTTVISRIQSNSASKNYPNKKRPKQFSNGKPKHVAQTQVDVNLVVQLLPSKEAREEVLRYEEVKKYATSELDGLYNEIRPAIEERERDTQDSVPTSVAEKWIEASCSKLKAEFDLYSSIIKNCVCITQEPIQRGDNENEVKFLTN